MKNAATTEKNAETTAQALRGLVADAKKLRAQMGEAAYAARCITFFASAYPTTSLKPFTQFFRPASSAVPGAKAVPA